MFILYKYTHTHVPDNNTLYCTYFSVMSEKEKKIKLPVAYYL